MRSPETRYAVRPDGVNIAYQVLGEGPPTLIWCWGWISHADVRQCALGRMIQPRGS